MTTLDRICDAIQRKRKITCTFSGLHREAIPLVLLENDDGEHILNCWQTGGDSSLDLPDWGSFNLSGISDLVITDEPFTTPEGYDRTNHPRAICWVDP